MHVVRIGFTFVVGMVLVSKTASAQIELIGNGDFENGTVSNFQALSLGGSDAGGFRAHASTTSPFSGTVTAGPAGGSYYAIMDVAVDGEGTYALVQSFEYPIESNYITLSFDMFVYDRDCVGGYVDSSGLDHTGSSNLHARVDILTAASPTFDTGTGVVTNLYLGVDPPPPEAENCNLPPPYTSYTFDLTPDLVLGQVYQLRFACVQNLNGLIVGVDNVSLRTGSDPCYGNPCGAGGTCTADGGGYSCVCGSGFTNDGGTCIDVDECAAGTHDCDMHATCTNGPGTFECNCNAGYEGNGEACSDIDECAAATYPCDTNATCTNTDGAYTCTCSQGFTGSGVACDAVCGDGLLRASEVCDDGNVGSGDGCSPDCTVEPAWSCDGGEPTVCSPDIGGSGGAAGAGGSGGAYGGAGAGGSNGGAEVAGAAGVAGSGGAYGGAGAGGVEGRSGGGGADGRSGGGGAAGAGASGGAADVAGSAGADEGPQSGGVDSGGVAGDTGTGGGADVAGDAGAGGSADGGSVHEGTGGGTAGDIAASGGVEGGAASGGVDAGSGGDAAENDSGGDSSGCGCFVARRAGSGQWALVLLLAAAGWRRRRSTAA